MKLLNMTAGFVAPPPDVEHVVTVGFLTLWLTRNTKAHNGSEGKMFYAHYATIDCHRWLFPDDEFGQRKWKTVEKYKADAMTALRKRLNECLEELTCTTS